MGGHEQIICYYDDDCGFCEAAKTFFTSRDRKNRLLFIGRSRKDLFRHHVADALMDQTIVVYDEHGGGPYLRSKAFGQLTRALPWYGRVLGLLAWPGFSLLADLGYRLVAMNRARISRWMGLSACQISEGPRSVA